MLNLDILPYPEIEKRIRHHIDEELNDTIDTIVGLGQQVTDNVQTHGNGTAGFIIGVLIAALAALGICLFFVAYYRRHHVAVA